MGNVSTARVNQCNVTYTCPGDQDDPENRTALCLEGSSAWQGLGCPALHPTTPGKADCLVLGHRMKMKGRVSDDGIF